MGALGKAEVNWIYFSIHLLPTAENGLLEFALGSVFVRVLFIILFVLGLSFLRLFVWGFEGFQRHLSFFIAVA